MPADSTMEEHILMIDSRFFILLYVLRISCHNDPIELDDSSNDSEPSGSRHTSDSDQTRQNTAVHDVRIDTEVPKANKNYAVAQITTQDKSNYKNSAFPSALSSNLASSNAESQGERRRCKYWTSEEDTLLRTLYETHGTQ
jgi:hypothetical protein